MPFTRKKYDGNISGGYIGTSERRNTFGNKSKTTQFIASKRTNRRSKFISAPEEISEDNDKDRYLITYSDLITLLLGLFIILYSISNVDAGKYKNIMDAAGSAFGTGNSVINMPGNISKVIPLKNQLEQVIKNNNFENSVKLEETERGITIHILGDILFSSGNANMNQNAINILNKISDVLKNIPNDIRVEGHTDNIPISNANFPSNWHLSVARALNTAYYLINQRGLSPDKVAIVGYSEYKPIADNNTLSGRNQNRRVDLVIINK